MIKKVVVENFQSHARTEMELSPAVTAIVGESDVGKSAVLRALRWLMYNEPRGANFVRRGARTCRVAVEYEDGTALIRERSSSSNRYIVRRPDGAEEIYEGFGAEVPREVGELIGAHRIDVNGVTLVPNLANQMDPPFLLGETGSTAAATLGLLSRADVFDAALRGVLADKGRVEREARALTEEVAVLTQELERYADLPAWEEALERAGRSLAAAQEAGARKDALTALIAQDVELRAALERAERLSAAGRGLERAAELAARAGELATRRERLARLSGERGRAAGGLAAAVTLLEAADAAVRAAAPVQDAGTMERRLAGLTHLAAAREEVAAGLAVATAAADAAAGANAAAGALEVAAAAASAAARLADLIRGRAALTGRMERAAEALAVLERAAEAGPTLERCTALYRARERLVAAAARRAGTLAARHTAAEGVARAEEMLGRAAAELAEELRAAGRCPVCLSTIQDGEVDGIVAKLAG